MPYILNFVKPVQVSDRDQYINNCCIGGDLVLAELLPALEERYGEPQSEQEDWGWFAWFEHSGIRLAVDVHTIDDSVGEFQMHLTSRKLRLFLGSKVEDTPELESLRDLVVAKLKAWEVGSLEITRVNEKHVPV